MNEVNMAEKEIDRKVLAIVCFGPATPSTGMRPADYYQVTIDPNTQSPSGKYIRFGLYNGDEIQGWQRIEAITVVEILGNSARPLIDGVELLEENKPINMMAVE